MSKEQEIVQVTLPIEQLAGYRQVPVRADISEPPPGYQIKTIEITPTTTIVQGTPEALEALSVINTDPIDLSQLDGGQLVRRVFLRLPPGVTLAEAQIAQVRVELQPITSTRQLNVAPRVTGLKPNLDVSAIIPETVDLVIGGPALVLDSLDPGDVSVTLDVARLPTGTHLLEPVVELPEGLSVEGVLPQQVEVLIQ
jgi:YbbR domain-containing protein